MILLDSDHLTILKYSESEVHQRLRDRLLGVSPQRIGKTIVNVEEQMRGWLAVIAKERALTRQVSAYRELKALLDFFAEFEVVSLESRAVDLFAGFRRSGIRIGTMDLKVACIVLASGSLLLTANRRDCEKVPGLRFESWIE